MDQVRCAKCRESDGIRPLYDEEICTDCPDEDISVPTDDELVDPAGDEPEPEDDSENDGDE